MQVADVVALGYRYPTPGSARLLGERVEAHLRGATQRHMRRFVEAVEARSLAEREELHTATLDLSPSFVPYVGHVVWGENYRRGEFMADLKRELVRHGVDLGGELPDHIEPVLRYLAVATEPFADLVEVLPGAVASMRETLHQADPGNPYCELLAATEAVVGDLRPLTIGGRR